MPQAKTVGAQAPPSTPALEVNFQFADAAEAEAQLNARVRTELVGEGWLGVTPTWSLTLPASATTQIKKGKGVQVSVRVGSADVSRWLSDFEQAPLQAPPPVQWQTEWLSALQSERAQVLCQRRQELLGIGCAESASDGQTEGVAVVKSLASRLVLEPNLPEGVPVAADGALLWPVRVRVWQRTDDGLEALASVPITVQIEAEPGAAQDATSKRSAVVTAVSAADGSALLSLPAAFQNARVLAFAPATLGPLARHWPAVAAKIRTRPLDPKRCALIEATGPGDTPFSRSVRAQLQSTLGREPLNVPNDVAAAMMQNPEGGLPGDLTARIVEATQGQLDYVARVAVESEFASQMGNGRTWYEARAHVKVFEVWTGKVVDVFDLAATEQGIGDQGADAAARERLGMLVAARLGK